MKKYFGSKQKGLSLCIGLALFVLSFEIQAQPVLLNNPSFEGPTGADKQPPPWSKCNFNTPDTQPSVFGISTPAFDGNTYIGLTDNTRHSAQELVGQLLPNPLEENKNYSLNLMLASATIFGGGKGRLEIWGGISSCSKNELLWKSDTIQNTSWKQYKANFTPSTDLNYLLIVCYSFSGGPYILIDKVSDFIQVKPKIWYTNPSKDTTVSCTQSLSGRTDKITTKVEIKSTLLIKTIQATLLNDTTWQSGGFVYPKSCVQKKDTLIAFGYFANGDTIADTLILSVNCQDTCTTLPPPIVQPIPYIPNMITPNKDGKNDFFEILNLPQIHRIEIYNRWGQNVFESSDYKNDWQGEEGVYYYLLSANNKTYKGWLQVIE